MKTLKDKDLQAHYDAMFAMFGSDGWKQLMVTVQDLLDAQSIDRIATVETLWYHKGERANLNWLKGMQASHEFSYDALVEERDQ